VEWRSYGVGWHAIADRLGTRAAVCQRWPQRYPQVWIPLMRSADARRYEETERTASHVLDRLLHDADAKVRERAERLVSKYRMRKEAVVCLDGTVELIWRRGPGR
jgi:hypothetical protein